MAQQRSQAPGGRSRDVRGWRQGRLALAGCLLALAATGLRATVPATSPSGSLRHDGLLLAAAAEAVLACLLTALVLRRSRAPEDAVIAARLRRLLTYIVVFALVAIPVGYLLATTAHVHLALRPAQRATGSQHLHGHVPPARPSATGLIVIIVVLALAAAFVIYLIARFIATYRGTWGRWRRSNPSAAFGPAAEQDEPALRQAVESGRSALRLLDDARAAIIACYLAMEQSLARAGTTRAAADTPDELLARAAGHGLVQGDAAARLTALFYEARFSSHPMPPAQREEAQRALAELADSLSDREPAGAGGPAMRDGTGRSRGPGTPGGDGG